jgi:hypothetical protein
MTSSVFSMTGSPKSKIAQVGAGLGVSTALAAFALLPNAMSMETSSTPPVPTNIGYPPATTDGSSGGPTTTATPATTVVVAPVTDPPAVVTTAPVPPTLPVATTLPAATTTTAAKPTTIPPATTRPRGPDLPRSGSESGTLLRVGTALLGAGIGVVAFTRRRRDQRPAGV